MLGSERIFLKFLDEFRSIAVTAMFFFLAAVFLFPVLFFLPSDFYKLSTQEMTIITASVLVNSLGFFMYVKAISVGDASLVAPLYNFSLLWLMFLGLFLLNENVNTLRVSGAMLMFVGVFFLYPGSIKEKIKAVYQSKASVYMIIGSVFMAFGRTIDTIITKGIISDVQVNQSFYAFLLNFSVGVIFLIIALFSGMAPDMILILKEKPLSVSAAGFVNGWAYLALLWAIFYLQATIAVPASLLSVFVTAILAKVILKENVEQRVPGMILMVSGAILLSLSS